MSKTYLPYDPDQPLLLPLALQEWLPEDHNPSSRGYARNAFFGSVWNPLIQLAHRADGRLLAELDRVSR